MKYIFKIIITSILKLQARLVLWKYKPTIIAVTGSVGKTTTKDAIYELLQVSHYVRRSEKSYNSEIGIPLTILGCKSGWGSARVWFKNILEGFALFFFTNHYPKVLVLEVGADRPGDIKNVAKWIKPDVVVITRVPKVPAHIEFFPTPEDIVREKASLISALKPNGLLVLNADDTIVLAMEKEFSGAFTTYGTTEGSVVRGSNRQIAYDERRVARGLAFKVENQGNTIPVQIDGIVGSAYMSSVLAAIAVAAYFKVNIVRNVLAFRDYHGTPGRLRLIQGMHGSTIIDDTYNASPVAMEVALEALKDIKPAGGRRVAVLGDMLELGQYGTRERKRIGVLAGEVADLVVLVGESTDEVLAGIENTSLNEKHIQKFADSKEAGKYLAGILEEGDVVLVKGSQGARMERTILEIMQSPEYRRELLVRQEDEWMNR